MFDVAAAAESRQLDLIRLTVHGGGRTLLRGCFHGRVSIESITWTLLDRSGGTSISVSNSLVPPQHPRSSASQPSFPGNSVHASKAWAAMGSHMSSVNRLMALAGAGSAMCVCATSGRSLRNAEAVFGCWAALTRPCESAV
jgi:hypothetical protein